jgi:hypothetical protein
MDDQWHAMSENRDDFKIGIKQILAHRAGFRCSKPSCRALTAGPSSESGLAKADVGVAAHITAASPGGPRYDPNITSEERSSIINGIWLCQVHGKEIDDDTKRYTPEVLRAWKLHAEDDARSLLGKPISAQAIDVVVEVALHRAPDDSLLVTGSTNLPEGTRVLVELYKSYTPNLLGQAKASVQQGLFAAPGFTNRGKPHIHSWYTVNVLAYFNTAWQQPDATLSIVGQDGEFLAGRFAEPLHPELAESERRIHASFECIAPPITTCRERSLADIYHAIQIVKEAVLTVDRSVSSGPVGNVVDYYMRSPGLLPRGGWSAQLSPNGAIIVSFAFWDAKTERSAEWVVILDTGEVRYRNKYAKYMSWMPNY